VALPLGAGAVVVCMCVRLCLSFSLSLALSLSRPFSRSLAPLCVFLSLSPFLQLIALSLSLWLGIIFSVHVCIGLSAQFVVPVCGRWKGSGFARPVNDCVSFRFPARSTPCIRQCAIPFTNILMSSVPARKGKWKV